MSTDLPLHVQMLLALRTKVENRQGQLEAKCGGGLEDREYQRHVGRIAECKVVVELIAELMHTDLDEVSDFLENERELKQERATPGARRRKRTGAASALHR